MGLVGAGMAVGPLIARTIRGRAKVEQIKKMTARFIQQTFVSQVTACKSRINQEQIVNIGTDENCQAYCRWAVENCTKDCHTDASTGVKTCKYDIKDADGTVVGQSECQHCKEEANGVFGRLKNITQNRITGITMNQDASIDTKCIAKLSSKNRQRASIDIRQLQEEISSIMGSDDHSQISEDLINIIQQTTAQSILDKAESMDQKQQVNYCEQGGERLEGSGTMSGPILMNQRAEIVSETVNTMVVDNSQWSKVKSEVIQKAKKDKMGRALFWVSMISGILFIIWIMFKLFKSRSGK